MSLLTDPTLFGFALINAIMAFSLYVTFATGLFSLANAGFMAIGAYTAAKLAVDAGFGPLASTLVGVLASVAVAFVVALPFLRLRGIYLALLTFAFGEVVFILARNLRGITNGQFGLSVPRTVENPVLAITALVVATIVWRLRSSRFGQAADAIRQDELVAEAMGVPVKAYTLAAFVLSAAIAGLAGGLWAHHTYFISPDDFGFSLILDLLLFVVIGGMYDWYGALVGAFALTYVIEALNPLNAYRPVATGLLLTVVVVASPRGVAGTVTRLRQRAHERATLRPAASSATKAEG